MIQIVALYSISPQCEETLFNHEEVSRRSSFTTIGAAILLYSVISAAINILQFFLLSYSMRPSRYFYTFWIRRDNFFLWTKEKERKINLQICNLLFWLIYSFFIKLVFTFWIVCVLCIFTDFSILGSLANGISFDILWDFCHGIINDWKKKKGILWWIMKMWWTILIGPSLKVLDVVISGYLDEAGIGVGPTTFWAWATQLTRYLWYLHFNMASSQSLATLGRKIRWKLLPPSHFLFLPLIFVRLAYVCIPRDKWIPKIEHIKPEEPHPRITERRSFLYYWIEREYLLSPSI